MSEIILGDIPIPLINYVYLIKDRRSPYYDIVQHVLKEMEKHYKKSGAQESEVVYTINPRVLYDEIEKRVKSEKLTTVNICRTILALLLGSNLHKEEDFYVTTTSGGRKNYHIKVSFHTLNSMHRLL